MPPARPPEFIASSQASVDFFKLQLAEGLHPTGALAPPPPPPPPAPPPPPTLTSDHDNGGVDEGSTVTFTLQSTNTADFGKTFNYNISGSVSAADIVGGSLVGTVTLDATGKAFVAVTLVADATTEGAETLTLNVDGLTDTVTVNDTSTTPVTHNFTAVVGETLTGSNGADTFVGVVDRQFTGDQTTLSNIVDIANGGGGVDTEEIFVHNNFFNTEITPTANSVEIFQVTDRPGSNFDMRFVPDVLEIDEVNSDNGSVFNNVQNLVDIGLINPDANGVDMTVHVADTLASGPVNVTLVNANKGVGAVDITYNKQSGGDIVSTYNFHVTGQNNNIDLHNTTLATTINIDGTDATAFLDLDLVDGSNGLGALTSIDASGFAGALTMDDIGLASPVANDLTVLGAKGANDIEIQDAAGHKVDVTTQGGTDKVTVTNQGAGEVTVVTNGGDGDAVTVTAGSSPSGDVSVTEGSGKGDKVTVTNGTNTAPTAATNTIHVGSGQGDVVNVNTGDFHTTNVTATGDNATITVFGTSANAPVTITADGGDAQIETVVGVNSPIIIEATGTGGVVAANTGGFGVAFFNPLGTLFNQTIITATVGAGPAPDQVTTGAGADLVTYFANGAAVGSNLNISTGAGNDEVILFDNGDLHSGVSLNGGGVNDFDILSLTAAAAHGGTNGATVLNFEGLEINQTALNSGVVVSDFGIGVNGITKVILDNGFTNGADLEGVNSGLTLDLFGASAGQTLTVEVTGANVHTNDLVNIDLHHANSVGAQDFGRIDLEGVETIHVTSDGVGTGADVVDLVDNAGVTTTLNLEGSHELDLTTENIAANALVHINAGTMTGALHYAPAASNGNYIVTLGSGDDVVTFGNGNSQIDAGAGNDHVTVGSGSNSITGGAGVDTITFGLHIANVDTIVYKAASDSAWFNTTNAADLTHTDQINGFGSTLFTDKIDLSALHIASFNFVTSLNATGTLNDVAGDAAGVTTAVFQTNTNTLYIDVNGDHALDAAHDMQIHLTGSLVTAANFII